MINKLKQIIIPKSVTSISQSAFLKSGLAALTGYEGSYAQKFASANSLGFNAIPNEIGDIDNNHAINAIDASMVLTAYASISSGKASGLSNVQQKAADANSDGIINSVDASCILSYYSYLSNNGKMSFSDFMKK